MTWYPSYCFTFVAVRNIDPITFQKKMAIAWCANREYGITDLDMMTRGLQLLFKGHECIIICDSLSSGGDEHRRDMARVCSELAAEIENGDRDGFSWFLQLYHDDCDEACFTNITYENIMPSQEEFSLFIAECLINGIFYEFHNSGASATDIVDTYALAKLELQDSGDGDLFALSDDPAYHAELKLIIDAGENQYAVVNSFSPFGADIMFMHDRQTYEDIAKFSIDPYSLHVEQPSRNICSALPSYFGQP